MFNRVLNVPSPTGQQRRIDLDWVTRVTHATDSCGCEVLVFCFGGQAQVKIRVTVEHTEAQNQQNVESLNDAAPRACAMHLAA